MPTGITIRKRNQQDIDNYRRGQEAILVELESLPIYLWPIDLTSLLLKIKTIKPIKTAMPAYLNGASMVISLVKRLPLWGMAWRIKTIRQHLRQTGTIDDQNPLFFSKE